MEAVFASFKEQLQNEQERRKVLKEYVAELDDVNRVCSALLQRAHSHIDSVGEICAKARGECVPAMQAIVQKLKTEVTRETFWKYNSMWKNALQTSISLLAFLHWLETEQLLTFEETETLLQVAGSGNSAPDASYFNLEIENYLVGVTFLPSELARLCVNAVITGNFALPKRIALFVKDMHSALQLLNLKNDFLRKRFDSIKYDLKKIEEVNFEIALRGLDKNNAPQGEAMDVVEQK